MAVQENSENLVARKYYIEARQDRAITLKTAACNLDRSGVVRAALDMYLSNILANAEAIDKLVQ